MGSSPSSSVGQWGGEAPVDQAPMTSSNPPISYTGSFGQPSNNFQGMGKSPQMAPPMPQAQPPMQAPPMQQPMQQQQQPWMSNQARMSYAGLGGELPNMGLYNAMGRMQSNSPDKYNSVMQRDYQNRIYGG